MEITINGEPHQVPKDTNLSRLVDLLKLGDQRIAIEVNEELAPRSTFESHALSAEDKIEIIQAIGGG
ncbi:MAG: sulfur carrier protein ThiS [Gammaproteobacteria bacterium]|nr:sulfur carrier protein ThiS [Gammaproteobacteria bacterium]